MRTEHENRKVETTMWLTRVLALATVLFFFPAAVPVADEGDRSARAPGEAIAEKTVAEKKDQEKKKIEAALRFSTPVGTFAETTTIEGKVTHDLRGVWFMIVNFQLAPADPTKFKSFALFLKISQEADQDIAFQLLDVMLPDKMQVQLDKANNETLLPWQPSSEQLELLGKTWATLKPYTEKTLNEHIYARLEYTLIAQDHFATFMKGAVPSHLEGASFGLRIGEYFRPGRIPPNSPVQISQVMGRISMYGFTIDEDRPDHLEGIAQVAYAAAGAGFPLPFTFPGSVAMYRIASPEQK